MKDEEERNHVTVETSTKTYGLGHRHIQSIMVFMCVCVSYIMRANISVAIIDMTDTSSNTTDVETYDWDQKTQGFVLGSFFWGYMLMQIPASQLAQRFGAKKLLTVSMIVNGVATLFFAQLVHMGGWKAACAVRAIQGQLQSCLMPCVQIFLSNWAHISERSRISGFVISGESFGVIVSMFSVGVVSGRFGWPMAFQVIGALALVTGLLWWWMGSDRPALHTTITQEERDFIESTLEPSSQKSGHKAIKTPWKKLFTSVPFLTLVIAHIGSTWSLVTMMLETPSYLKLVLGVSSENSGLYAGLPYTSMFILSFIIGFLSDFLVNKKIISLTNSRKIANTIGSVGLGGGIIIMSYIPTDQVFWSVAMLILSTGLSAAMTLGFMLNHVDLSPNLAGALMGITNTAANGFGTLAPISAGYILKDPHDITQWRTVFIMICVIMNGCNLVFVIFGTSDVQPWNQPDTPEDIEMKNLGSGLDQDLETKTRLLSKS